MGILQPVLQPVLRPLLADPLAPGFGITADPLLALFTGGVQGGYYNIQDLSTVFQDSAGTTAGAVGQPVGRVKDKSGNANHLLQATTAAKPILRLASGFYYLEFDGVDDFLATSGNLTMGATSYFSVVGQKVAGSAGLMMCGDAAANQVGLLNVGSAGRYAGYARIAATIYSNVTASSASIPDSTNHVIDARIKAGTTDLRTDNVANTSAANTLAAQTVIAPLGFSSFGGSGACQMTRVYGAIALAADISDTNRSVAHRKLAAMAGVTVP